VQDEEKLLQRAKGYDSEALTLLYRRHVGPIYRYIYLRVGQEDLAQDLTADVFLRALEGIGSFQYRGVPFAAWLFRIAHDRVVDHFRRRGMVGSSLKAEAVVDWRDPVARAEERAERERLRRAMEELTEEQRQVVALRFGEGFTSAEVARMLGKSEGAVKALQYRALAALRRILERDEGGR
jgi:RNA polymerase sigma-70 factor (ECF subfamily)